MKTKSAPLYSNISLLTKERVLILAPHPDDETFGCGGSIALHTQEKDPVKVVFLTDGSRGDFLGHYKNKQDYVLLREEEAKNSLKILGVTDFTFLKYEDQTLIFNIDNITRELTKIIEDFKPTLVYIPAQTDNHIDHKVTNNIFWSVFTQSKTIELVLCYEIHTPTTVNCFIDISKFSAIKKKACHSYKSQLEVYSYDQAMLALNVFRAAKFPSETTHVEAFSLFRFW